MTATRTDAYRAALDAQRARTVAAVAAVTRMSLSPYDVDRSWPMWSARTYALLNAAQDAAFDIATTYVDDLTAVAVGASLDVAVIRPRPNPDRALAILRLDGPITVKTAAAEGKPPDVAGKAALSRVTRFAATTVTDRASDVVWTAMAESDYIVGYRRVIRPGACSRCQQIATTRMFSVTPSRSSGALPAGYFRRHPRCTCTAEPVYASQAVVNRFRSAKRGRVHDVPADLVSERAPLLGAA